MNNPYLVRLTSVTEIYGTGQKVIAAVIQYNTPVSAATLSPSDFEVEGRTIDGVFVSDSYRGAIKDKGYFVELALNSEDPNAATKEQIGTGRYSRLAIRQPDLTISQLKSIRAANDEQLPPFYKEKTTDTDNGVADRFAAYTFQETENGLELDYNLYVPQNCVTGQKYPLVLFMHDAGSCSDDVSATLAQGNGAVVWARDNESGKRPCYVVAPHYPEVCANDDFEVTWQTDATVSLIKNLMERFPIDKTRIYGTGQSMGCMMLCEMILRNPCFFAGNLLVAGQWNPNRMAAAKDENIWSVVSSGDKKAFPIMGECLDNMEKAGGKLSKGHLDAKADMSILAEAIRKQKTQNCNLNFSWFDGKSILPPNTAESPGMHHIMTWTKAYDIEALREWLFEQRAGRL